MILKDALMCAGFSLALPIGQTLFKFAAVNNEKIARTRDLERIAKDSKRRWAITLVRGGQTISVQFGG